MVSSPDEALEMIRSVSLWAWYARALAYEFELQRRRPARKERKKLPSGPDMRQLCYLGLMNVFVSNDQGQLSAARWIAGQVPASMSCEVVTTSDFFENAGFPLDEGAPFAIPDRSDTT